jgi:hypothetical protein
MRNDWCMGNADMVFPGIEFLCLGVWGIRDGVQTTISECLYLDEDVNEEHQALRFNNATKQEKMGEDKKPRINSCD